MIKLKLKYREINRRKINDISMLRIHTKVEDYEDCCLKERREQILNIDILRQNRKNNFERFKLFSMFEIIYT